MKNLKFRKSLTVLIMVMPLFLVFSSCKTKKSITDTSANEKGLLWEITGNGVKSPSYIFGTIHLIPATDFFLPPGTMSAIDASKKVFFEIDMKQMTDMSAIMGIMNKIYMKNDTTLQDLITPEDYKLVSAHFEKAGLPIFMLEKMKPMFLSVFASTDMDPSGMQNGSMKSYEMEILELAEQTSKPTGGLETMDFQLGLFDEIPYKVQAKMLVEAITMGKEGDDSFDKMVVMYKTQDIHKMANFINNESDQVGGYEDKLLTDRNRNWIPIIKENIAKEACFFAVGAGHLGGKTGVVNLLREAGYKLKPVK